MHNNNEKVRAVTIRQVIKANIEKNSKNSKIAAFGAFKDIFNKDSVTIQKKLRKEWMN
jgi:hypothetical protein